MLLVCGCGEIAESVGSASTDTDATASDTDAPVTTTPETDAVTTAPVTETPVTTTPEPEVVVPDSHRLQFSNSKTGIYNYCPSVMQVSDTTAYIYYCTNKDPYNVTDYIGCRKATLGADGRWTWGDESLVLSPTAGTWDARHVCDPSVVMGEFSYNGETYSCLMAYLGCVTGNSQENDLGIAVAKSPEGPFVKVGNAPLVDFVRDMTIDQSIFQWGVGQPSIINMDKKGSVTLFYTRGDHTATRTIVEEWDMSDLNAPVRKSSVKLSEAGLKNLNNHGDILNNADFVYDAANRRFYSSSDCHPNPVSEPNFISSHFRVTYFDQPANYSSFTWKTLVQVGEAQTGFARNHNTGMLRDAWGHLPNSGYVSVFYTVSITGSNSLWSYKIYDYHLKLG